MDAHRLRAPSVDGEVLAVPPVGAVPALLDENLARLSAWEYDFQGRSATRLRHEVRRQVVDRSLAFLKARGLDVPERPDAGRLIVTGHQPELFHPGVWVKNFAVADLARETSSVALNLIVDNDIPKSSALKVPRDVGGALRVERVAFDEWAGEVPYEDLKVRDESLFAGFAAGARGVLGGLVDDPVLDEFWPRAVAARATTDLVGLRFATARRALEAARGVRNLELPLSEVCESEGFQWFACHLLAHLPRFRTVHNEALACYRALYGIRSTHHPVPALGAEGEWLEAPFWVWRSRSPRRKPLLARQLAKTVELRIGGENETLMEVPLGPDRDACCAVERLMELPSRGVRLRTRALTTTLFARHVLGDLFVHGIGGAKYDELGDEVSGRFFGFEPPTYLTMSMTLWLGLGNDPDASGRLAESDRVLRDLVWNPDRHLPPTAEGNPEAAGLVAAKRLAVAAPAESPADRRARFHEIRRCNDALRDLVAGRLEALGRDRSGLVSAVRREAVARSREFSLVLHSRRRLDAALVRGFPGLRRGF